MNGRVDRAALRRAMALDVDTASSEELEAAAAILHRAAQEEREPFDPYTHEHARADSWIEYDAQGIYLTRVCDECREHKLAEFRPEILTGYDQSDVSEDIEPDTW